MSPLNNNHTTLKRKRSEVQSLSPDKPREKIVVKSVLGGPGLIQATRIQQKNEPSTQTESKNESQNTPAKPLTRRTFLIARRPSESRKRLFLQRFQQGELLGEGGFGKVYSGIRRKDGLPVAIKYIHQNKSKYVQVSPHRIVPSEVHYHSQLQHPNIIRLLEHHFFDKCHVLVIERPRACTDLFQYLADHSVVLGEDEARPLFRQLLQAVSHMEQNNIVHNDLKSENILLDLSENRKVKLIDFGLAQNITDEPIRSFSGTPEYCPPEYHSDHQYDGRQATVWSLGCILYDMLVGNSPYQNAREAATLALRIPDNLSKDVSNLLSVMLEKRSCDRASLNQLLVHPWVSAPL